MTAENNNIDMMDRYKGAMLGHALGDAMGAPFENTNAEETRRAIAEKAGGTLRHIGYSRPPDKDKADPERPHVIVDYPPGFWTDDTAQMRCIAESIIDNGEFLPQDAYQRLQNWMYENYMVPMGFERMGSGRHTRRSLSQPLRPMFELHGQEDWVIGDGSLMRTLPIALAFRGDFLKIKEYSILSSYITHNNKLSGWYCVAYNTLVALALDGTPKESLAQKALIRYGDEMPKEIQAPLLADYASMGERQLEAEFDVINAFRNALWAFFSSGSFEDTIKRAVSLGGDTDTYGALSGALSGAYYGYGAIPSRWAEDTIDCDAILRQAEKLLMLNRSLVV